MNGNLFGPHALHQQDNAQPFHRGTMTYMLSSRHYVCFPAGQRVGHSLVNHTSEPWRYLVFGNPQPHDVAVFPESGRESVKLTGEI